MERTTAVEEPRKTEVALRAELKTAQEVLALQQKETYKFQDHIEILDSEIDSLKVILEEKQTVINNLQLVSRTKEDKIAELEKLVYENQIDRHAYKTFEHQNILLLEELREKKSRMEELEIEVRFLRNLKQDKTEYDDEKAMKIAEMDIIMSSTVRSLELQIEDGNQKLDQRTNEVIDLSTQLDSTMKELHLNEDLRREQVSRSRQSEYRTLSQLQKLTHNYHTALDENEVMQETLHVKSTHNNMIQKQLTKTAQSLDESQEIFGKIIDQVENKNHLFRKTERNLIRENESLRAEVEMLRLTIDQLQEGAKRRLTLKERFERKFGPAIGSGAMVDTLGQGSGRSSRGRLPSPSATTLFGLDDSLSSPLTTAAGTSNPAAVSGGVVHVGLGRDVTPQSVGHLSPLVATTSSTPTADKNKKSFQLSAGSSTFSNPSYMKTGSISNRNSSVLNVPSSAGPVLQKTARNLYQTSPPKLSMFQQVDIGGDDRLSTLVREVEDMKKIWMDRYLGLLILHQQCQEEFKRSLDLTQMRKGNVETAAERADRNGNGNDSNSSLSSLVQKQVQQVISCVSLVQCRLRNDDLGNVITWMRKTSFAAIHVVDLTNNDITGEGLLKLVTWILAVPDGEIPMRMKTATAGGIKDSPQPLRIKLQENRISSEDIKQATTLLRNGGRTEFHYVAINPVEEGDLIVVYGAVSSAADASLPTIDQGSPQSSSLRKKGGRHSSSKNKNSKNNSDNKSSMRSTPSVLLIEFDLRNQRITPSNSTTSIAPARAAASGISTLPSKFSSTGAVNSSASASASISNKNKRLSSTSPAATVGVDEGTGVRLHGPDHISFDPYGTREEAAVEHYPRDELFNSTI